ncbi:hypothetical protein QJS10_CPB12g01245 [Acorus calamus]|uniref:Trafficking protein particle complex subunit 12 n=1 Tax=Acorus calamus TaxID=4465 RepID=A0AAV9DMT9_ACOCL|nr:hypothetical protein QJS10_CPB12g01245 [Acorus calamus]
MDPVTGPDIDETLSTDLQRTLSLSDPLTTPSPSPSLPSPLDDCLDVDSLQELAVRGSWRSLIDKVSRARKLSLLKTPHEHLVYLSFNVLSLLKLRRFSDAASDLSSLLSPSSPDADPFDDPRYRYETYPDVYPGRSGSMVPFALRWIHALLPQHLGRRSETLDRLYLLLDLVRRKAWKRREVSVLSSIVANHFAHREFNVCLALIGDLLRLRPSDPVLLSRLGYVQTQMGDLEGARDTFARVEALSADVNLVSRNRAMIRVVEKEFTEAVREYEVCVERDPSDVVAINNKALCLMYSRDLSGAIKVLEGALERVPTEALNETVVVNLCSMYELAHVNHSDVKKSLGNWIAKVAPDDFDSSCTRL